MTFGLDATSSEAISSRRSLDSRGPTGIDDHAAALDGSQLAQARAKGAEEGRALVPVEGEPADTGRPGLLCVRAQWWAERARARREQ